MRFNKLRRFKQHCNEQPHAQRAALAATAVLVWIASVPASIAAPLSYQGVIYDPATKKVTVKPSKFAKSKSPDSTSQVWNILDGDLISDQVMTLQGALSMWHEYKTLGHAQFGDIVLHEEFNTKFPARVTQIEFQIPKLLGQKGESAKVSDAAKMPLEYTHLVYAFRSRDLLESTYDAKGVMVRCGVIQQDGANSLFDSAKEAGQNFSKYQVPPILLPSIKRVSVNRTMRDGLDQVDFIPKPNKAQLDHVFLIHQYNVARLFEVLTFDLDGKLQTTTWCKFPVRPVDEAIAKYYRNK